MADINLNTTPVDPRFASVNQAQHCWCDPSPSFRLPPPPRRDAPCRCVLSRRRAAAGARLSALLPPPPPPTTTTTTTNTTAHLRACSPPPPAPFPPLTALQDPLQRVAPLRRQDRRRRHLRQVQGLRVLHLPGGLDQQVGRGPRGRHVGRLQGCGRHVGTWRRWPPLTDDDDGGGGDGLTGGRTGRLGSWVGAGIRGASGWQGGGELCVLLRCGGADGKLLLRLGGMLCKALRGAPGTLCSVLDFLY